MEPALSCEASALLIEESIDTVDRVREAIFHLLLPIDNVAPREARQSVGPASKQPDATRSPLLNEFLPSLEKIALRQNSLHRTQAVSVVQGSASSNL